MRRAGQAGTSRIHTGPGASGSDTYADLLTITARLADNARSWSTSPEADLPETDDRELDRIVSQVRVVGSDKVYQRFAAHTKKVHQFNRIWLPARDYHASLRAGGGVDDQTAIQQRMSLASIAGELEQGYKELEALIRKEIGR